MENYYDVDANTTGKDKLGELDEERKRRAAEAREVAWKLGCTLIGALGLQDSDAVGETLVGLYDTLLSAVANGNCTNWVLLSNLEAMR